MAEWMNQIHIVLQIVFVIVIVFFYGRKNAIKHQVEPRVKKLEAIVFEYYLTYFFRCRNVGAYPKLEMVYRDMAIKCHQEKIDNATIKRTIERTLKKDWIAMSTGVIGIFTGVTGIITWLTGVKSLADINMAYIKEIVKTQIEQPSMKFELTQEILIALFVIGGIVLLVRLLQMNESIEIKFSYESQLPYILEDFVTYYKGEDLPNKSILESTSLLLTETNKALFDIKILRLKDQFKLTLPKNLWSKAEKKKDKKEQRIYYLADNDEIKEFDIEIKEYKYRFERTDSWKLVGVQHLSSDKKFIQGSELENLQAIFELLFEWSIIDRKNMASHILGKRLVKLRDGLNTATGWKKILFYILVVVLFVIVLVMPFIFMILIHFYIGYILVWLWFTYCVASWLIKKLY